VGVKGDWASTDMDEVVVVEMERDGLARGGSEGEETVESNIGVVAEDLA